MPNRDWVVPHNATLRCAGFPAGLMKRFDFSGSLEIIDAAMGASVSSSAAREVLEPVFQQEVARALEVLRSIGATDRFRQAMFLSSVTTAALDSWLFGTSRKKPGEARRCALTVVNYLQRFCMKNDTASFFGPTAHLRFDPSSETNLDLRLDPAAGLTRKAFFSHWAVELLADVLLAGEMRREVIVPRRRPTARLIGDRGYGVLPKADGWAILAAEPVGETAREVYNLVDGRKSVAEIEAAWREGRVGGRGKFDEAFGRLVDAGWVLAGIDLPYGALDPMERLRGRVSSFEGQQAVAEIDGFLRMKEEFDRSTTLEQRKRLYAAIAHRFEALTASSSSRGAGKMYADRSVMFEDAVHETRRLSIGGSLHRDLLSLNRLIDLFWIAADLQLDEDARVMGTWFLARFGDNRVSFLDYAVAFVEDSPEISRRLEEVRSTSVAVIRQIYDEVVPPAFTSSEELVLTTAQVDRLLQRFPPRRRDGVVANPDVFVLAKSIEDVNQGRYGLVLGELHISQDAVPFSSDPMFWPPSVRAEVARDSFRGYSEAVEPGVRVMDLSRFHVRKTCAQLSFIGGTIEGEGKPLDDAEAPATQLADLDVAFDPRTAGLALFRANEEIRLTTMRAPIGIPERSSPLRPFSFPRYTTTLAIPADVKHVPRVVFGNIVIQRRTWKFEWREVASWLDGLGSQWDASVFIEFRRLQAAHGLPDHVYAKIAGEVKPHYVCFANYLLLHRFGLTWSRRQTPVTVSEALPGPDDLWFPGEDGERGCELRYSTYGKRVDAGRSAA
jgi:hypothetical protein